MLSVAFAATSSPPLEIKEYITRQYKKPAFPEESLHFPASTSALEINLKTL
jgi:hypothetical protein